MAALRRRVRAPQRVVARPRVPRHPRDHGRRRLVRGDPAGSTSVVPFISAYRPFWLGLGAVAFDLLLALVVTSLLRHRLGYTTWRAVDWLVYACWPVAVLHGLGTGSDAKSGLVLAFTAVCIVAVLVAGGLRVGAGLRTTRVRACRPRCRRSSPRRSSSRGWSPDHWPADGRGRRDAGHGARRVVARPRHHRRRTARHRDHASPAGERRFPAAGFDATADGSSPDRARRQRRRSWCRSSARCRTVERHASTSSSPEPRSPAAACR